MPPEQQAALRKRLEVALRTNTYNSTTGEVVIDPARAEAFESLSAYYADVFSNGRPEYAIPRGSLVDPAKAREMSAFF